VKNVTRIVKNVTRILKMLPQYRHQCSIVPKCFTCVVACRRYHQMIFKEVLFPFRLIFDCFNATLNNISAISILEVKETGLTLENHRPWTNNWSTLFNLIEAEKDIDIKVYKLFIHNNDKNHKRIPWRPVLMLEEAGVPGENHRP